MGPPDAARPPNAIGAVWFPSAVEKICAPQAHQFGTVPPAARAAGVKSIARDGGLRPALRQSQLRNEGSIASASFINAGQSRSCTRPLPQKMRADFSQDSSDGRL